MKPRPRLRRTVKWGGLAATVCLGLAWLASAWWCIKWENDREQIFGLWRGGIGFLEIHRSGESPDPGWRARRLEGEMFWLPTYDAGSFRLAWMPLWVPMVPTAATTALVWWRESRARRRGGAGTCPACGYSLAGLPPGAECPECGVKAGLESLAAPLDGTHQ